MRYNRDMALTPPKWAVYYGTIELNDGSFATYTALQIATLYGVQAEPYLSIPVDGPYPWINGPQELSYYHLKPLADEQYFNAIERYNTNNEVQWDEDFDARRNGKWAVRPQTDSYEDM